MSEEAGAVINPIVQMRKVRLDWERWMRCSRSHRHGLNPALLDSQPCNFHAVSLLTLSTQDENGRGGSEGQVRSSGSWLRQQPLGFTKGFGDMGDGSPVSLLLIDFFALAHRDLRDSELVCSTPLIRGADPLRLKPGGCRGAPWLWKALTLLGEA